MYRVLLKTAVVEALRAVFDGFPDADFQGKNKPLISIEFPVEESHYPGIWVQYADDGEISIAGISHTERAIDTDTGTVIECSRWRFAGSVTMTLVALHSWELDKLFDQVVRLYVGAEFNPALAAFRQKIESNDLIAMNANFDDIEPVGDTAAQGTPWQTDEMVYEVGLRFDIIGEFVTDQRIGELVPLSNVTFTKYLEGFEPLPWAGAGSSTAPSTPGDWDRTKWH